MSVFLDRCVVARREGCAGILTLNRPSAMHALTTDMCEHMTAALLEWKNDPTVELVIVEAAEGTKGFCAGGDVKMLVESGRCDGREARAFFQTEYRLNALIASYPKPYIAFIDGITMGGGVGISVHGSHTVATERTVFAMPETAIGLFPDVGGTWFLPRLRGELGLWLGLSGERLKGADVLAAGVATHYVSSSEIATIKRGLVASGLKALDACQTRAPFSLEPHLDELDRCFKLKSVRGILCQLNKGSEWARRQARKINAKSPLSLCITYRQLRMGSYISSFRGAMMLEYRIASRLISSHDFREGVRAALVDKDHAPDWRPKQLFQISDDLVASYFKGLGEDELKFDELDLT